MSSTQNVPCFRKACAHLPPHPSHNLVRSTALKTSYASKASTYRHHHHRWGSAMTPMTRNYSSTSYRPYKARAKAYQTGLSNSATSSQLHLLLQLLQPVTSSTTISPKEPDTQIDSDQQYVVCGQSTTSQATTPVPITSQISKRR